MRALRIEEVNGLVMPNLGISKPARTGSGLSSIWRCCLLSDMGRIQTPSNSCVGSLVARERSRTEVYQLPHAESQSLRKSIGAVKGLRLYPIYRLTG